MKQFLTINILFVLLVFSGPVLAIDTVVDVGVFPSGSVHLGTSSNVVFVSDKIGYAFTIRADGTAAYHKTTSRGSTWTSAVTVDSQTDCIGIAVWYDRWTPGDTSGNLIHIVTVDSGMDDLWYTRLNVSGDTLSTPVSISSGQGGTFTAGFNLPSVTKATDGDLYAGIVDGDDGFVLRADASQNPTVAANWAEAGTSPFDASSDWLILMPISGGDILAVRSDLSEDDLDSKVLSNATGTWDAAWTDIDTNVGENTSYSGHLGATLDKSTGVIYLAWAADVNDYVTQDHDIRTARYSGGAWVSAAAVLTDTPRGVTGVKLAFNENSSEVICVYTARTDISDSATGNVYYKKSTDSINSWGKEQGPLNETADNIFGARINLTQSDRIYAVWIRTTTAELRGNSITGAAGGSSTGCFLRTLVRKR